MIIRREDILWGNGTQIKDSGWELLAKELSEAFDRRDRDHFMVTLSRLIPNVYVPPISPS